VARVALIAFLGSLSTPLQGLLTSRTTRSQSCGQIKTALVGGIRVDVSREYAWNLGLISYKVEVRGATGLAQADAVKYYACN
jgi:hypothetical protein